MIASAAVSQPVTGPVTAVVLVLAAAIAAAKAGVAAEAAGWTVAALSLAALAWSTPWSPTWQAWWHGRLRRRRRGPRIVADRRHQLRRAVLIVPPSRRGPRILRPLAPRRLLSGRPADILPTRPRRAARIVALQHPA